MHLSRDDLQQMDEAWLKNLPTELLLEVSKRLLADVKTLHDRLGRNPSNSSRPPSSRAPWEKAGANEPGESGGATSWAPVEPSAPAEEGRSAKDSPAAKPARRAGRQTGSAGHGRTQKLALTETCEHRPSHCTACDQALSGASAARAYTAWDEIDLVAREEGELGLRLKVTRHRLLKVQCGCGHVSRAQPWRAADDVLWEKVGVGQWRLLGPRLAGLIVLLALRLRLSRERIRELLDTLLGLSVSSGLIDQTVREAGRLSEPLEDALVTDLHGAAQVHIDETPWPESGTMLWLWVVVSVQTVLYLIGPRTRAMLDNALATEFAGIVISDGYGVYRARPNRLRCWAHLLRKVRGLSESSDWRAAAFGTEMAGILKRLQEAIYAARTAAPPVVPAHAHAKEITRLRALCEHHRDDAHAPVRRLAREFINDWDVIMRPLEQPQLPLTNNAAEQALRHWVIARRLSYGTRSATGSRAFGLLASIIDTCRRRGACAGRYLERVIDAGRHGLPLPDLPAATT